MLNVGNMNAISICKNLKLNFSYNRLFYRVINSTKGVHDTSDTLHKSKQLAKHQRTLSLLEIGYNSQQRLPLSSE